MIALDLAVLVESLTITEDPDQRWFVYSRIPGHVAHDLLHFKRKIADKME